MSPRLSRKPATTLAAAFQADKEHALTAHHRGMERLCDYLGVQPHVGYRWLAETSMPARMLPGWAQACGSAEVIRYLAATAHLMVVPFPTGKRLRPCDLQALQAIVHEAIGALMAFHAGQQNQAETMAALTEALGAMAFQRENVERFTQPELELE